MAVSPVTINVYGPVYVTADPETERLLSELLGKVNEMDKTLDEVLVLVTAQDTALDSVRELIAGLRQQLADALANANLSPENQAKVNAVFDGLEKNSAEIVEALAANTPPAP